MRVQRKNGETLLPGIREPAGVPPGRSAPRSSQGRNWSAVLESTRERHGMDRRHHRGIRHPLVRGSPRAGTPAVKRQG